MEPSEPPDRDQTNAQKPNRPLRGRLSGLDLVETLMAERAADLAREETPYTL